MADQEEFIPEDHEYDDKDEQQEAREREAAEMKEVEAEVEEEAKKEVLAAKKAAEEEKEEEEEEEEDVVATSTSGHEDSGETATKLARGSKSEHDDSRVDDRRRALFELRGKLVCISYAVSELSHSCFSVLSCQHTLPHLWLDFRPPLNFPFLPHSFLLLSVFSLFPPQLHLFPERGAPRQPRGRARRGQEGT